MSNAKLRTCLLVVFACVLLVPGLIPQSQVDNDKITQSDDRQIELSVHIDARNITRSLIHSTVDIPVKSGFNYLWFPKWIPGIHAPRGAIQNMAGLLITDEQGNKLEWKRDPSDVCRFQVAVPENVTQISCSFDYICNQPSTNSVGVDSFGNHVHGVMSWNNILLYPESYSNEETFVNAQIQLPDNWKLFTALKHEEKEDALFLFEKSSLREVIDSPVICGQHHQSHQLNKDGKDVWLHIVGSNATSIECSIDILLGMEHMVTEARLLFGHEHYPHYHFLLMCSNETPRLGLEHLSSSLNGVNAMDLPTGGFGATRVMAHEYVHSWCGKYRRPAGMFTNSYHYNKDTTLLWVYEGLTQYLGNVLAVRSGLREKSDFRDLLRYYLSTLRSINGRSWRSLADTATASYLLRARSHNWAKWLRGQDYYIEGALVWLEADCLIRQATNNEKSLDDFCKAFLGKQENLGPINPFTYQDILVLLNEVHRHDWDAFFQKRVYQEHKEYDLSFMKHSGWEVSFEDTPEAASGSLNYYYRNAFESIGIGFTDSGRVYKVLKNGPGYQAGLAKNMHVEKINGRSFSPARLHQALMDARNSNKIKLDVRIHEEDSPDGHVEMIIEYDGGPRYLVLKRVPDTPDYLFAITDAQRE